MRQRAVPRAAAPGGGVVHRDTLPEFVFHRPTTVAEALALLARHRGRAALLAGGTDLLPRLRVRERVPEAVVDLKGLAALGGALRFDRSGVRIPALARVADLARHAVLRRRWPVLVDAAAQLGTPQVRERATLGGNLMRGTAWADLALPLLVLDATARVLEARGTARSVPLGELLATAGRSRRPQLLAGVTVPSPPRGLRAAFLKLETREAAGAPIVAVAVAVVREGGWVRHARIALGNAGARPLRVPAAESLLAQHVGGPLDVLAAASEAADAARPPSDPHGSADYRRELVRVLVRRALEEVLR
jgi:CO/xanthine dehydrogenase FAD-binding subunit